MQRARTRARTTLTTTATILALAAVVLPARAHDVSCATTITRGEWHQFGNDVTGARNQDKEMFLDARGAATLRPVWTFDANRATAMENNEITGYPIVADGCVFVGSSLATFGEQGWIFALNADTGELVWRVQTEGGVYNTLAYDDGVLYAFVSRIISTDDANAKGPYVVALDAQTGDEIWRATVDRQIGADAVSSPVVFDGMVWVGVSGTAAEVNEGDRSSFVGNQVLLDAATGQQLAKIWTIPDETLWEEGFTGGAVWSTMSVDPQTKYGYVGTGNPFDYENEHENTNAILKVDLDRYRPTFGEIVGTYKGTIEEYVPELADTVPCQELEEISGVFAAGLECLRLDLDFGAQPNVFTLANGRRVVGAGQKSGVYHVIDADTMEPVYTQLLGVPSAVGGIVGSAAYDGQSLYGPHTLGGYMWSIRKQDGAVRWVAPTGSGVNWGPPATYANRVIYTVDLAGFLDAFDAGTGAPLLKYPLLASPDGPTDTIPVTERPPLTWGGATVANGTVYVSAGVGLTSAGMPSLPSGYVIAFRAPGLGF